MTFPRRKRARRIPSSIGDAVQACLDHALKQHNRGVKRVADLMGLELSTLYKKVGENRLTVAELAAFEHACGATHVTEYLCAQAHLLAVEMPAGRKLQAVDAIDLQQHFAEAMALLLGFYKGEADQEETLAALAALMGEIGWHRANVERANSPELPLYEKEGGYVVTELKAPTSNEERIRFGLRQRTPPVAAPASDQPKPDTTSADLAPAPEVSE
jgi:hypothetical protein